MNAFISIGTALIVGVIISELMKKFKMPSVAGYIIAGLILGVSGLKIVDLEMIDKLSFISDFALAIIAFNIGSELKVAVIKKLGKSIFIIAACEAFGAFSLVTIAVYFLTHQIATALILGTVAIATAPAATIMVLKESKAKGALTSTLIGVIAVDDAICLMLFSMAASIAKGLIKHKQITIYQIFIHPITEISVAIASGCALGIMLCYLLHKFRCKDEVLKFISGILLLLVGVCSIFNLSILLTAMSMGIIVANVSPHSEKAFSSIETFSPPIISAFFILAGCRLDISYLPQIGVTGIAYFIFRIVGKISGASFGAKISNAPIAVKKYLGFGLLSQVGIAIGLAITVSKEFSGTELGSLVIAILLATTIVTELIAPVLTKNALIRAKETTN